MQAAIDKANELGAKEVYRVINWILLALNVLSDGTRTDDPAPNVVVMPKQGAKLA